jgi:hypothetical protein
MPPKESLAFGLDTREAQEKQPTFLQKEATCDQ